MEKNLSHFFLFYFLYRYLSNHQRLSQKKKKKTSPKIESNNESLRAKKEHPTYFLLSPSSTLPYRSPITTPFLHPLSLQIERILGQKPSINRTNPFFSSQRCFEFSRLKSKERERQRSEKPLFSLSLSLADPWRSRKGRRRRRREGKGKEITRGTLAKEYFNRWKKRWKREGRRRRRENAAEAAILSSVPPPPAPPPTILEAREGEQAEKNNPI